MYSLSGTVYLDHAGATLFPQSQLTNFTKDLLENVYGKESSPLLADFCLEQHLAARIIRFVVNCCPEEQAGLTILLWDNASGEWPLYCFTSHRCYWVAKACLGPYGSLPGEGVRPGMAQRSEGPRQMVGEAAGGTILL